VSSGAGAGLPAQPAGLGSHPPFFFLLPFFFLQFVYMGYKISPLAKLFTDYF
jgi:hypothetical protein